MLLNNLTNKQLKQFHLSKIYNELKQCLSNEKRGSYWFAPLLSLNDQYQLATIVNDLSKNQYGELLRMINVMVVDLVGFYNKNVPQDIYRLLHLTQTIHGLNPHILPLSQHHNTYSSTLHRIHYYNILSIFLIKNRQYNTAIENYQQILSIIKEQKIDIILDVLLAAMSNYLLFVRSHQYAQVRRKIGELVEVVRRIYQGLVDKYTVMGCRTQSIHIMLAVFKQHQLYLDQSFQAQNRILIKKYQETNNIANTTNNTNQNTKIYHYLTKNNEYKIGKIQIKKKQLNFFTSSLLAYGQSNKFNKNQLKSAQLYQKNIEQSAILYNTLDTSQLVTPLRPNSRRNFIKTKNSATIYNSVTHFQQNHQIANKIKFQPRSSKKQLILVNDNNSAKKQPQVKIQKPVEIEKRVKLLNKNEPVILKVNYSIIQVISDGIILSDFLRQRKKFITWQEIFILLKNLRFSCVFSQFLPICTYYDIGRIISSYVRKVPNHEKNYGAIITAKPKQLLQINMFTKLYKIQGKFFRLLIMNQYDTSRPDMSIDFYLAQFQQFFKKVTDNQYINKINQKIFQLHPQQIKQNQICNIEQWKRKKQTTAMQLSAQLKIQTLKQLPFIKSMQFKILLFLPNLTQIVLQLRQKDLKQAQSSQYLSLAVTSLSQSQFLTSTQNSQLKLKIPLYKITRFFPFSLQNASQWFRKYGKFIVQGYLKCFSDFPYSFNNLQYLQVTTYAKKVQIMESGRYYTPVTAQIIGSETRIWGMCIRYYEQSFVKENVTFLYSPYYDLLAPMLNQSPQQRKITLIKQLYKGTVIQTYKKLVEKKLTGTMVNIMQYWYIIDF